ncbi:MAG: GTPase Era involved in 16S rRNA processing [Verrucomicrobiales bacterium]|jgi:GTPase Era involved in 16S rRNA processing
MPKIYSVKDVVLSLISHTNVGKTALARTLLRQDVGEVADRAHVTVVSEAYPMIEDGEATMRLWDTPGFGAALAKLVGRLRKSKNPVGWLLHQVWDRLTDKSLWCSQEAIRNIREDADIVLYLVDGSQDPDSIGYVDLEMEILEWIGKPVLVLLNQTGEPKPNRDEAEVTEWRNHLSRWTSVRHVLSLDAFARCWVQEREMLDLVRDEIPEEKKSACEQLLLAWRERNLETFANATDVLGRWLAESAEDSEPVSEPSVLERIGLNRGERSKELESARQKLCERLAQRTKSAMDELIQLYGLSGEAARKLEQARLTNFEERQPVNESLWGTVGGVLSGAVSGLAADLLAGGLTLGGGMIAGAAAGGAGGFALAKGYNLAKGEKNTVRWREDYFLDIVKLCLTSYLAVSHFGRGRGEWQEGEIPAFWLELVASRVAGEQAALREIWQGGNVASSARTAERLLRGLLVDLYPETRAFI